MADLEPGDRVLLYTDGVTEARDSQGRLFGLERFTDMIIRATAGGELAFETLRRLIHYIVGDEGNELRDDATLLLVEWLPGPLGTGRGRTRRVRSPKARKPGSPGSPRAPDPEPAPEPDPKKCHATCGITSEAISSS